MLKKLFKRSTALANNTTPAFDRYWDKVSPALDNAGVHVDHRTAEGVSAVYACVSAISETVASLPLDVYRDSENGREKAKDHPLFSLLHYAPNDWQTALEFREMLQRHVLLRGNGYARIVWDANGRPMALKPMHPDSVTVLTNTATDRLLYDYTDRYGKLTRLTQDDVLHLRFHSDDGILGRTPIQVARDTVGLALAEQTHGASMFAQGTKLSGVIQTPPATTPEQARNIQQSFAAGFASVTNHGKTPVLPAGAEFKSVSMTLEDAEWIEARKLSVIEICRLFRVPPVIVQSMESANYSNSVELARQFVTLTLRRHLTCWEQAINRLMLSAPYYAEHNVEGLLRGDSTNRATFYQRGIEDGWLLKSEVRQMENLPKVEGIDDDKEKAPAATE